jgi:flagellar motor protein MotB
LNSPEQHQEIIIIKRSGEGEHGHHGGAWKIAFADFMTAMMALFLVLWLINAANEETKKAVASYFNPVKLVERNRSERVCTTPRACRTRPKSERTVPGVEVEDPTGEKTPTPSCFADPFAVLDEIAANQGAGRIQNARGRAAAANGNDAINDAAGGEAFMDPFSPNFWNEEVRHSNNSGQLTGRYETEGHSESHQDQMASAPGFGSGEGVGPRRKTGDEEVGAGPGRRRGRIFPRKRAKANWKPPRSAAQGASAANRRAKSSEPETPVDKLPKRTWPPPSGTPRRCRKRRPPRCFSRSPNS